MSDEPINHKLLARNKHRGGKTVDKNTSRGKYKKQEYEQKKKEREEFAKREQDPNYRPKNTLNNSNNNSEENNDKDNDDNDDNDSDNGEIKFNHSRSKYSKRVLLQNDHSKLVKLDEKYYNQGSLLNMQSLIDSKVDFIPKFDNLMLFNDADADNDNYNNNNNNNKTKTTNNDNTINTLEIEKLLSSFTLSKRLNIDDHYLSGVKLPNPSNIVHLKRKSNKHLVSAESVNKQQQQQQPQPQHEQIKQQKTISNTQTNTIINKDNEEITLSPIVKDTADKAPIDNGNVTSDNLEDWLDTII
ncbi:hypothetical protein DDB_G0291992 [Dictyostelium discoideum AX4]|uniref:Uncharacterized protein n=1 Tax=Dictyostelium discoideum TaxID=44689 RepID=Q54DU2_DICDI|nr:hypothetical protein DDB_G0291992 [Dictyostelium discoideum AX4]EAL61352.1 hypothetical protein DDB_G0291992 [Dictyostelium discoideum AX4]|eukprot:XP_629780.1 hypothetical protein DDB_G0291992 [Dictyostelium discoideum AX4]